MQPSILGNFWANKQVTHGPLSTTTSKDVLYVFFGNDFTCHNVNMNKIECVVEMDFSYGIFTVYNHIRLI